MQNNEINRIKARLEKCEKRIKAGYSNPGGRGETEQARKERLTKRLAELAK